MNLQQIKKDFYIDTNTIKDNQYLIGVRSTRQTNMYGVSKVNKVLVLPLTQTTINELVNNITDCITGSTGNYVSLKAIIEYIRNTLNNQNIKVSIYNKDIKYSSLAYVANHTDIIKIGENEKSNRLTYYAESWYFTNKATNIPTLYFIDPNDIQNLKKQDCEIRQLEYHNHAQNHLNLVSTIAKDNITAVLEKFGISYTIKEDDGNIVCTDINSKWLTNLVENAINAEFEKFGCKLKIGTELHLSSLTTKLFTSHNIELVGLKNE